MTINRNIVLNLIFIALFVFFLILSLLIDFFFFIPLICFLPFSFRTIKYNKENLEERPAESPTYKNSTNLKTRYCPRCSGEITQIIAKYCYHCGEKLNNK